MLPAISKVISTTLLLYLKGILSKCDRTIPEDFPVIIATILPFFPLASLFIKIV